MCRLQCPLAVQREASQMSNIQSSFGWTSLCRRCPVSMFIAQRSDCAEWTALNQSECNSIGLELACTTQGRACCSCMMARCGSFMSHSSLARWMGAPGTPRARASSVAVKAAWKWPLPRHSLACASQHLPASASAPVRAASCRLRARMGSCGRQQ